MVQIIQFHPKPSLMTWRVAVLTHLYPCTKPTPSHVMQWSIRPELVGVQIWWKYDHLPAPRSNTFPLAIRTLGWCFFVGHVFLNRKLGKILTPFGCRTAFCIWVQVHLPLIQNWPNNSSWKYRGLTPLVSTSVLQASYKWSQRARWLCRLWFHSYFVYFPPPSLGKNDPIWRAYFFRWLETPTSRMLQAFWQIEFSMYTPSFWLGIEFLQGGPRIQCYKWGVYNSLNFLIHGFAWG